MCKSIPQAITAGLLLAVAAAPGQTAVLGPQAAACAGAGAGPAMLVRIEGLKTRTGILRVQSYGGDPAHFFDKGSYLQRIEVRPPATGPAEVCVPVPREGTYAVSVRHDVEGQHKTSLADGGGMSGNPNLSLMDVMFKRRPPASQVSIEVRGVKRVPITLNYVRGTSFGSITAAER